ncbi:family 10 glycosylhydrolase [Botrimarina sp.]|uniref:family 10 glycosylhydrolase n=1 Tax=Botrimarina sp. TaxID=2795802 RepID=UPI0032EB7083
MAVAPSCARAEFDDFRGLWISRFEYNDNSSADIRNKINAAADLGITDVIWQVRGKADAYYQSAHESPAEGWNQAIDPLQVAIDTAHARGVKLHAWLNTMPLWRDTTQPSDPSHIYYNSDPSFRVTDSGGAVEQTVGGSSSFSGGYSRINHVLPEAQQHISNVVQDIATNYAVDGIHLDYIRWLGPGDAGDGFRPDWDYLPHDPYSHQLYFNDTGQDASDGSTFAKREAYRDWVQGRITDLVELVGDTVDNAELATGRQIDLSAAVWNNPTTAERDYMQDYRDWLSRDLLDIAIPMVYLRQSNSHLLDNFLDDIFSTPTNSQVSIGLGTYLHTPAEGGVDETLRQVQEVYDDGRADSLTFFSWRSLLDGSSLSSQRAAALVQWYEDTFVLEGDYNDDGLVDAADYTLWRDTFLQFGDLPADGNGDGFIGNADYDLWAANYGASAANAATIPEPAAVALLAALGLAPRWAGGRPLRNSEIQLRSRAAPMRR